MQQIISRPSTTLLATFLLPPTVSFCLKHSYETHISSQLLLSGQLMSWVGMRKKTQWKWGHGEVKLHEFIHWDSAHTLLK